MGSKLSEMLGIFGIQNNFRLENMNSIEGANGVKQTMYYNPMEKEIESINQWHSS